MFYVFDARESQGYLVKTRLRWLARLVAIMAGRHFDYTTVPFASDQEFGRLTF